MKIVCITTYKETLVSPFAAIPGVQLDMDFTLRYDPMCRRVTRPSQRGTVFSRFSTEPCASLSHPTVPNP